MPLIIRRTVVYTTRLVHILGAYLIRTERDMKNLLCSTMVVVIGMMIGVVAVVGLTS